MLSQYLSSSFYKNAVTKLEVFSVLLSLNTISEIFFHGLVISVHFQHPVSVSVRVMSSVLVPRVGRVSLQEL